MSWGGLWFLRFDPGARSGVGVRPARECSLAGACFCHRASRRASAMGRQVFDPGPGRPCELRVGHQAAAALTQAPPRGQL